MNKLIVITGLDGSGTSTVAKRLQSLDPSSIYLQTPTEIYSPIRDQLDRELRTYSREAHYHFYLSSVIHASKIIEDHLPKGNVYCVRYLLDTVVSHRVSGMEVDLVYKTETYSIIPPDYTFFLDVPEEKRQKRISKRGKSFLDEFLDEEDFRNLFLDEFNFYKNQIKKISNETENVKLAVDSIRKIIGFDERKGDEEKCT